MKTLTLAVAALAAMSTPLLAGGPTVIADDPMPAAMPAPADAHDWSGAYVGLAYGRTSGSLEYSTPITYDLNKGKVRSLYAGYLMQRGNLVFGGELAVSNGSDTYATGFPLENIDRVIDLKGKVGFAADRVMFYGALGVSKLDYEFSTAPALNYSTRGVSYGLGVDYALTERFTMGLEYLARKTDGDVPFAGLTSDIDLNTVSLRAGFSF